MHRLRCPRGRLCLEEDDPVLLPEPGALLLDLAARTPAKAVRVAAERIEPELLLVRGRTCRHEELEIVERRRAKPRLARSWRGTRDEDRLARAIPAGCRETLAGGLPELRHCGRLADQHPRCRAHGLPGERSAAAAGRNDVDAEVAQRMEVASAVRDPDDSAE